MRSTLLQPPFLGRGPVTYPPLRQLVRVTTATGNVYNGFVQQNGPSNRDREACYIWEPNGIVVPPGIYRSRLVSNYQGLPLYAISLLCCTGAGPFIPPGPSPSPSLTSPSAGPSAASAIGSASGASASGASASGGVSASPGASASGGVSASPGASASISSRSVSPSSFSPSSVSSRSISPSSISPSSVSSSSVSPSSISPSSVSPSSISPSSVSPSLSSSSVSVSSSVSFTGAITTCCCPNNTLPAILYLTITGFGTAPLFNDPTVTSPLGAWNGSLDLGCGSPLYALLQCIAVSPGPPPVCNFVLGFSYTQGAGFTGCTSSFTCVPFFMTNTVRCLVIGAPPGCPSFFNAGTVTVSQ